MVKSKIDSLPGIPIARCLLTGQCSKAAQAELRHAAWEKNATEAAAAEAATAPGGVAN